MNHETKAALWRLLWLFTLTSLAGFLLESGESLWSLGYVQNRQGVLFGPFAPVYGVGAVTLALAYPAARRLSPLPAFLLAMLLGTLVEFLWSWGQERLFGVVFWDYHHFRFHIQGRVNLVFSLFWGCLGLLFWRQLWPRFLRLFPLPPQSASALTALVLILLFSVNGLLSTAALLRQAQRRAQLPALSPVQLYLDRVWPDETLKTIFPTMRRI